MTLNNTRVRELLIKMAHHRQTCLPLVDPHSHMNIARSAYRFVKIEKVMIKKNGRSIFLNKMATTLSQNTPTKLELLLSVIIKRCIL